MENQNHYIPSVFINSALETEKTLQCIRKLVRGAAIDLPIYRSLYGNIPDIQTLSDFQQLPITDFKLYSKIGDVSKIIKYPGKMLAILCPWNMENNHCSLTIAYSLLDEKYMIKRLKWMMEYIGIRRNEKLLFLISHNNRYSIAYIVNLLVYLGFQCQILPISERLIKDLNAMLRDCNISTLFIATKITNFLQSTLKGIKTLITFNYPKKIEGEFSHFDILHLDEIPLIAIQKKPNFYTWLQDHFYIEESTSHTLLLTTLRQSLSPFIRYDTGIRIRLNHEGFYLL